MRPRRLMWIQGESCLFPCAKCGRLGSTRGGKITSRTIWLDTANKEVICEACVAAEDEEELLAEDEEETEP